MGSGYVVVNLLIHSLSPHARRLTEEMFTGDPYHVDIKLDGESTNRSAEIANTYLKVLGRRLLFTKRKKVRKKVVITPIVSQKPFVRSPIFFNKEKNFDWDKDWEERQKLEERKKKDKNIIHPIVYYGQDTRRLEARYKEEKEYEFLPVLSSGILKEALADGDNSVNNCLSSGTALASFFTGMIYSASPSSATCTSVGRVKRPPVDMG